MTASTLTDDFDRLGGATLRAALPGIGLAFLSASLLGLMMGTPALASSSWGGFLVIACFVWFHGIYIAAITWKQIRSAQSVFAAVWHPGLGAGALLALPLFGLALLDAKASAYSCGDGAVYGVSSIPNLPWLWIGWAALVLMALPARAIGFVIGEQPPLVPLWRRAVLALPFAPFLWFSGHVFEWRTIDCSRPVECCGLFDGGFFILPLFGLFLLIASFSLAVLSAASVDDGVVERGPGGSATPAS